MLPVSPRTSQANQDAICWATGLRAGVRPLSYASLMPGAEPSRIGSNCGGATDVVGSVRSALEGRSAFNFARPAFIVQARRARCTLQSWMDRPPHQTRTPSHLSA